jgi:RNA polymerase sigma-70 factor (ECF subfamily)
MMEQGGNLTEKARNDIELVQSAMDGDEESFARLMARYKNTIYFMLLKMVNNKSDAEDLTLEAFGKAFKNLHQYSPQFAFSTWLFKIASNNCIDFLRKKRGNLLTIDPGSENNDGDSPVKIASKESNPEEKLIRKQNAILMRTLILKLKPRYQTLVEYRYFREMSYDEIARELKLPLGTVKAQLFRAREILFKLIETTEMSDRD